MKKITEWFKSIWNNQITRCEDYKMDWYLERCTTQQLFMLKRHWEETSPNSEELKLVVSELRRRYKRA